MVPSAPGQRSCTDIPPRCYRRASCSLLIECFVGICRVQCNSMGFARRPAQPHEAMLNGCACQWPNSDMAHCHRERLLPEECAAS